MHLQGPTACAFKIRAGNMDLRAGRFALINLLLQFKIGVGLDRLSCEWSSLRRQGINGDS
jgi:hypothetical protein